MVTGNLPNLRAASRTHCENVLSADALTRQFSLLRGYCCTASPRFGHALMPLPVLDRMCLGPTTLATFVCCRIYRRNLNQQGPDSYPALLDKGTLYRLTMGCSGPRPDLDMYSTLRLVPNFNKYGCSDQSFTISNVMHTRIRGIGSKNLS